MARDAIEVMGSILPDDFKGRDAVHVAVYAAEAGEELWAGDEVCLVESKYLMPKRLVAMSDRDGDQEAIGIVDPFLKSGVNPGQRFLLFLFPRTITGLQHWWSHPDFPDEPKPDEGAEVISLSSIARPESEAWLLEFCEKGNTPGLEHVLKVAEAYIEDGEEGEYLNFNGREASGEIPDEFWDHVEIVLGKKIPGRRPKRFSCAC